MASNSNIVKWNESPRARYLAYGRRYWAYLLRAVTTWSMWWAVFLSFVGIVAPALTGTPRRHTIVAVVLVGVCLGAGTRLLTELLWRTVSVFSDRIWIHGTSGAHLYLRNISQLKLSPAGRNIVRMEFEASDRGRRTRSYIIGIPAKKAPAVSALLQPEDGAMAEQGKGAPVFEPNNVPGPVRLDYARKAPASVWPAVALTFSLPLLGVAVLSVWEALVWVPATWSRLGFKVLVVYALGALVFGAAGLACLWSGLPWFLSQIRDQRKRGDNPKPSEEAGESEPALRSKGAGDGEDILS